MKAQMSAYSQSHISRERPTRTNHKIKISVSSVSKIPSSKSSEDYSSSHPLHLVKPPPIPIYNSRTHEIFPQLDDNSSFPSFDITLNSSEQNSFEESELEQPLICAIIQETVANIISKMHALFVIDGSCALISIVTPFRVYLANIGDCRAVLVSRFVKQMPMNSDKTQNSNDDLTHLQNTNNESNSIIPAAYTISLLEIDESSEDFLLPDFRHFLFTPSPNLQITGRSLTIDHKPFKKEETVFIKHAGGFISDQSRINGVLAVARAIGDFDLYPAVSEEADHFLQPIQRWNGKLTIQSIICSDSTKSSLELSSTNSQIRSVPDPTIIPLLRKWCVDPKPLSSPQHKETLALFEEEQKQAEELNYQYQKQIERQKVHKRILPLKRNEREITSRAHTSTSPHSATFELSPQRNQNIANPNNNSTPSSSQITSQIFAPNSSESSLDKTVKWTREDVAIVLACDGIYDVLSSQQMAEVGFGWLDPCNRNQLINNSSTIRSKSHSVYSHSEQSEKSIPSLSDPDMQDNTKSISSSSESSSAFGMENLKRNEKSKNCNIENVDICPNKGELAEIAALRLRSAASALGSTDNLSIIVIML